VTTTAEHAPVPATGTAPGTELRALTGLRIVAAAWVVLFHFHFTALPGVALVVGLLGPLVTQGALGVDLFFVLSGFVIAYTYLEKLGPRLTVRQTGRFIWARACRIWPAYALVFHMFGIWLIARAVYGTDPDIAFQAQQPVLSVGEWVQQLFMVQLWDQPFFDGASWVGPTWSISAEWLAYLLFPLVAVVFHRMRNLPFAVLAGGALALMAPIALSYLQTGSPYYPWSWLVRVLCGFGGGILTYLAVRRLRKDDGVRRAASTVASVTPVLIGLGLVAGELVGPGRGGAVLVLFPVLVGSLALADRGLARRLSTPAMVHGGRISYALYLVHIPMFEVFWLALRRFGGFEGNDQLAANGIAAHLVGLAVLVGTLPAAHLLYRWVEEPARTAMKRLPAFLQAADKPARHAPHPLLSEGPITRPLPCVPRLVRAPGLPIDTDVARRDPETGELPAAAPLAAEKAVGLSELGSWPAPRRRPGPSVPPVAEPVSVPPWREDAVPAYAPSPLPVAGAPSVPVVQPVPSPRPVERVHAARNAELRSPHPELAELVGSVLAKGRHRVRNIRPHTAPHIAGQRGPDRRGRAQ
jgi:peptidoglycan/LPS O-acetylase OafA/YrhL